MKRRTNNTLVEVGGKINLMQQLGFTDKEIIKELKENDTI